MLTLCLRLLRTLEKGTPDTSTLGLDEHCRKTRIHQDTPRTIAALRRPQPLHITSLAARDALRRRIDPALLQARDVPGISPLHDVKKSASLLARGNCCFFEHGCRRGCEVGIRSAGKMVEPDGIEPTT